MSVYRLRSGPTAEVHVSGQGEHENPCVECSFNDICVQGCCGNHDQCEQRVCHQNCDDCGGGPILRYQGGNVPAICSKAPLRDLQIMQARRETYTFTKRPLIKLKARTVIITQGSPGRVMGCPYPEEAEAIAVNLRHVWSSRGWFSSDMKDYLALSRDKKLILLTSTHDDVLERAWEHEVYATDLASIGFDYWQCVDYSQYGTMSRCFNLWSAFRAMYTHSAMGSHFALEAPMACLDMSKPGALAPWIECSEACPQLMVNWQFTSARRDAQSFKWMVAALKNMLKHMPAIKSVWFTGVVAADEAYNVVRNFPDVECYFMAVNPWLAAFKGDEFSSRGKLKKSTLPRLELVLQNQRNYAALIQQAITAARKELRDQQKES